MNFTNSIKNKNKSLHNLQTEQILYTEESKDGATSTTF